MDCVYLILSLKNNINCYYFDCSTKLWTKIWTKSDSTCSFVAFGASIWCVGFFRRMNDRKSFILSQVCWTTWKWVFKRCHLVQKISVPLAFFFQNIHFIWFHGLVFSLFLDLKTHFVLIWFSCSNSFSKNLGNLFMG